MESGQTGLSRRVPAILLKLLAVSPPDRPSERDLQACFRAFYQALCDEPERYGLPSAGLDFPPEGVDLDEKTRKDLNGKLKKIRDRIGASLELLMRFGQQGTRQGESLVLGHGQQPEAVKAARSLKKLLSALEKEGLSFETAPSGVCLRAASAPERLTALQTLALRCGTIGDRRLSRLHFARSDFRAPSADGAPDPEELYLLFPDGEREQAVGLHRFFKQRGYRILVELFDGTTWAVKYMGRRGATKVLFQIEAPNRDRRTVRARLKCAAANRLAPCMENQPEALREDFFRRTNRCKAPACQWCRTRPGLKPSELAWKGETRTVCWYVDPGIRTLDEETAALVRGYAEMHERLV